MKNNEGVSFIILIEKSNPNLRAQLKAITTVCNELECRFEVMVFVKGQDSDIEKALENVPSTYQINYEAVNFYPSALRRGLKEAKYQKVTSIHQKERLRYCRLG